jgi:hypothetical protein
MDQQLIEKLLMKLYISLLEHTQNTSSIHNRSRFRVIQQHSIDLTCGQDPRAMILNYLLENQIVGLLC